MENQQYYNPVTQNRYPGYQEPGRGTVILVLGILSITILGLFAGIPAWIMGSKDLKGIRDGRIALAAKSSTQVGMILGIVSTSISALVLVGAILVVGVSLFANSWGSSSDDPSVDDFSRALLVNECTMLAFQVQQYYKIPIEMGGGSNSFIGVQDYISQNIKRNTNTTITFENIGHESVVIIATGTDIGEDGFNPKKVELKVYPDRIDKEKVIN